MSEKKQLFSADNVDLGIASAVVFLITICFFLISAIKGYPIYRDIHLGAALVYAEEGVDVLSPMIVGFNANDIPTLQEVPVWQALVGFLMSVLGSWWGWGNVISLLFLFAALFPVYSIVADHFGMRAGWWAVLCFLMQPVIFIVGGTAGADIFALTVSIWFIWTAMRAMKTDEAGMWILAFCLGSLSSVSKLPFFFMSGLGLFLYWAFSGSRNTKALLMLLGCGCISALVFFGWVSYTNSCMAAAEFPCVDLRVIGGRAGKWFFGTLSQRLSAKVWMTAGWKLSISVFGCLPLFGIAVLGLNKSYKQALPFLLAAFCTMLVFFNLVVVHRHYYVLFSLPIALMMAAGLSNVESNWLEKKKNSALSTLVIFMVLLSGLVQGLISSEVVTCFDHYPTEVSSRILDSVNQDDKLIVQCSSMGGDYFIRTGLRGLTTYSSKMLIDNKDDLGRLKELGFNKLVLVRPSPLLIALQKTNPGGSSFERADFNAMLPESIHDELILYRDNDILISDLP